MARRSKFEIVINALARGFTVELPTGTYRIADCAIEKPGAAGAADYTPRLVQILKSTDLSTAQTTEHLSVCEMTVDMLIALSAQLTEGNIIQITAACALTSERGQEALREATGLPVAIGLAGNPVADRTPEVA